MNPVLIRILVIGGAILVGYASLLVIKKPDGPIEQAAESLLRANGVDIDLSSAHKDQ